MDTTSLEMLECHAPSDPRDEARLGKYDAYGLTLRVQPRQPADKCAHPNQEGLGTPVR